MSVTVISSVDPLATAMEQSSLASDSGVASAGAADAEFPEMGDGVPRDEPEPEMAVASKGSRKKGGKK